MPTTTSHGVPYPLGTDPLGETDLRIKALADFLDDRLNTRAKVYQGTTPTTFTTGVTAALAFDTEDVDPKGLHSTTTNPSRVTALVDGRYEFVGQIEYAANAAGYRYAEVLKNGLTVVAAVRIPSASGAVNTNVQVVGSVSLVVNDYLELRGAQLSGGNLASVVGLGKTFFDVKLCGAV